LEAEAPDDEENDFDFPGIRKGDRPCSRRNIEMMYKKGWEDLALVKKC